MGLSKVNDMVNQWKSFNMNKAVAESLKAHEKEIIEINQDAMYKKGIMNVETEQTERYSPAYIKVKKRKATFKETKHVTLKFFGDLYEGMKLLIFNNKFVITTTDLKWANYLEPNPRFGNALGLTSDGKQQVRDLVVPDIQAKAKAV